MGRDKIKILFLTNSETAAGLIEWLKGTGAEVVVCCGAVVECLGFGCHARVESGEVGC